jgi:hypothetical protein
MVQKMNITKIEKQLNDLRSKAPPNTDVLQMLASIMAILTIVGGCALNYSADSSPFYSVTNRAEYAPLLFPIFLGSCFYVFSHFCDATSDATTLVSEIQWCDKALSYLQKCLSKRDVLRWRNITIAVEIQFLYELDRKRQNELRLKREAGQAILQRKIDKQF